MTDTGVKPNVQAPTAKQFKAGPKVTLHRPGWTESAWQPHGFQYPIRFNGMDTAVILEEHFDLWVGDDQARVEGITVTRPKKESQPKATGAKKAPAKKTPAKKK